MLSSSLRSFFPLFFWALLPGQLRVFFIRKISPPPLSLSLSLFFLFSLSEWSESTLISVSESSSSPAPPPPLPLFGLSSGLSVAVEDVGRSSYGVGRCWWDGGARRPDKGGERGREGKEGDATALVGPHVDVCGGGGRRRERMSVADRVY